VGQDRSENTPRSKWRGVDRRSGLSRRHFLGLPLAAIIVTGTVGVVAGSSGAGAASSKAPIVVGVVDSQTGALSTVGYEDSAGVRAEIAILNKAGGVLGRKLVLKVVDDASSPQQAVSGATALLTQNKVDLFIGDSIYGTLQRPAVAKAGVLNVAQDDDPIDVSTYPTIFNTITTALQQTQPLMQYVATTMHETEVGILSTTDTNGTQFTSAVQSLASTYHIKVVSSQAVPESATDVTSELQQLRSAGAKAVLDWAAGPLVASTLTDMNDLGWTAPIVGLSSIFSDNPQGVAPAATLKQATEINFATATRTASGSYIGYNGIGALVKQIDADGNASLSDLALATFGADAVKLAAWAWERAGSVNTAAAVKVLNGMSKLPASALPQLYNWPKGTNLKYTKSQHTAATVKVPYSGSTLVKLPNTLLNGTFIGKSL
jgi:branched-chain amino acid transport system substrate-binding protein